LKLLLQCGSLSTVQRQSKSKSDRLMKFKAS